jgi:uncharacterized OB-fold protein
VVAEHEGEGEVAAYSVVHGRGGDPEWGVAVVELPDARRAYAKVVDADVLAGAEQHELVGRRVRLTPTTVTTAMGEGRANIAAVS